MKPVIGITCGDSNGIGPELALRSSLLPACRRECLPVLIGPPEAFRYYARRYRMSVRFVSWEGSRSARRAVPRGTVPIIHASQIDPAAIVPGLVSRDGGLSAGRAIEEAVHLHAGGAIDAIVTAPLSKEALHLAGYPYPGQTEMLQSLTLSPDVGMMLVSPRMRVGLLTIHIPLRLVPGSITKDLVVRKITLINRALQHDWRIPAPRIAVLGINPHAGENGQIGSEEQDIIVPALGRLRESGIDCHGPFPADGFFGRFQPRLWDAVVAAYHDQGLIPVKHLAKGKVVNVSIGLPIVRTSPGHGTAMDIAGKGKADETAMLEAIRTAVFLFKNRRGHSATRRS